MSGKWVVGIERSGGVNVNNGDRVSRSHYGQGYTDKAVEALRVVAQEECDKRNKEIEDKKFDITNHTFNDPYIEIMRLAASGNVIASLCEYDDKFILNNKDSIAIARHFYDRAEDKEAFINKIKGEA